MSAHFGNISNILSLLDFNFGTEFLPEVGHCVGGISSIQRLPK